MPNLRYHPMLREIIYRLDYSKIKSKPAFKGWYSSATHPDYAGNTIFEGHGSANSLWISVNIIEGIDDLFIHTTLNIASGSPLQNELNKFPAFNQHRPNTTLIRVGALQNGEPQLIQSIENNIFPYL